MYWLFKTTFTGHVAYLAEKRTSVVLYSVCGMIHYYIMYFSVLLTGQNIMKS